MHYSEMQTEVKLPISMFRPLLHSEISYCISLHRPLSKCSGCVTIYEVCKSKQDKGDGSISENKSSSTTQIQVDLGNLFNEKHISQQGGQLV